VGATLYTCISGTPPQAADSRVKKDHLIPLRSLTKQNYSDALYSLIDACLKLDHLERPQTAFDLQKLLSEEPRDDPKRGFLDTLNSPLSKLFSR
jgi:serine/threonine protein kinase